MSDRKLNVSIKASISINTDVAPMLATIKKIEYAIANQWGFYVDVPNMGQVDMCVEDVDVEYQKNV